MTAVPFLSYAGGLLCMEGIALAELAERLGTPFFLISESRLRGNYRALERGLAAAGARDRPALLRQDQPRGGGAGDCSPGAAATCWRAMPPRWTSRCVCGFPPERIAYARPVLIAEELDSVLGAGVPLVHVHRPRRPAAPGGGGGAGGTADPGLVASARPEGGPPSRPSTASTGGWGSTAASSWRPCRRLARLALARAGGGQLLPGDAAVLAGRFRREFSRGVLALLARVAAKTGVAIREVNLGGGIPSPSLRKVGPRRLLARWRDRRRRWPRIRGGKSSPPGWDAGSASWWRRRVCRSSRARRRAGTRDRGRRGGAGDPRSGGRGTVGVPGRQPQLPARIAPAVRPAHPAAARAEAKRRPRAASTTSPGSTLNTLDVLDLRRRLPPLVPGTPSPSATPGAYSISRASPYAGLRPRSTCSRRTARVRLVRRAGGRRGPPDPMILRGETERGAALKGVALVTGASGFLGRPLVAALLAAGRPVVALCRRSGRLWPVCATRLSDRPRRPPRPRLVRAVAAAGVIGVPSGGRAQPASRVRAREIEEVNVQATLDLARRAARAGVARFVHVSTALIYGPRARAVHGPSGRAPEPGSSALRAVQGEGGPGPPGAGPGGAAGRHRLPADRLRPRSPVAPQPHHLRDPPPAARRAEGARWAAAGSSATWSSWTTWSAGLLAAEDAGRGGGGVPAGRRRVSQREFARRVASISRPGSRWRPRPVACRPARRSAAPGWRDRLRGYDPGGGYATAVRTC